MAVHWSFLRNTKPIVLLAFASDYDEQVAYLRNLSEEARRLQRSFERAALTGLCALEIRQNATIDDIFDCFQTASSRGRITIFHFGGHANAYELLFQNPQGGLSSAHPEGLAAFLARQSDLHLLFLNGCTTQQQVQILLAANVPLIIATDRDIEDELAMQFADRFYRGIANQATIEEAFHIAAAFISTTTTSFDAGSAAPVPWGLYIHPDHPEAAHWRLVYTPLQKLWQHTHKVLPYGLALIMIVLLTVFIWRQWPAPKVMPANHFNIAVAPFTVETLSSVDNAIRAQVKRDAEAFAQDIADLLQVNTDIIASDVPSDITIWGPIQLSAARVMTDSVLAAMGQLNANILVTGRLQQVDSRLWTVEPLLYVADSSLNQMADDVLAENALGERIENYMPGNLVSLDMAKAEFRVRLTLLHKLIIGLSHYSLATTEQYTEAMELFCAAPEQLLAEGATKGLDLLYLFCGHAAETLSFTFQEDPAAAAKLADDSIAAYRNGIQYNPSSVRNYVSLGAALAKRGSPNVGCDGGNAEMLLEARATLQNLSTQWAGGIALRESTLAGINNSLGLTYFGLGCLDQTIRELYWSDAKSNFAQVLEQKKNAAMPPQSLLFPAGFAHMYLGIMALLESQGYAPSPETNDALLDTAAGHFRTMSEFLLQTDDPLIVEYAITNMPLALLPFCFAGNTADANQFLNDFVQHFSDPEATRDRILSKFLQPQFRKECGL